MRQSKRAAARVLGVRAAARVLLGELVQDLQAEAPNPVALSPEVLSQVALSQVVAPNPVDPNPEDPNPEEQCRTELVLHRVLNLTDRVGGTTKDQVTRACPILVPVPTGRRVMGHRALGHRARLGTPVLLTSNTVE